MSSANQLMKEMQKIASNAQIQVQRLANEATEKSFQYNTQEANTAREWQKEMSDTAHQREVQDLIKAGLNPVLSANSGAQSYTTSAASAQANDPSGSIGNLAGNLIQSRTSAYQADKSAAATRAAAAAQASATRFAAAANLAAAKESAAASRYAADKHLEGQKYSVDHTKQGAVINLFENAFKQGNKQISKAAYNNSIQNIRSMSANRQNFLTDPSKKASASYLNKAGKLRATYELNKYGIKNTYENRDIFARAYLDNDKNAMRQWLSLIRPKKNNMQKALYRYNSASSFSRNWTF